MTTESDFILTLTTLKALTVLAGAIFLSFALRAYLKHRARAMLVLLVAIALMTAAAVAEGLAIQVLGLELGAAHVIEASFTLAAFVILVLSVISHRIGGRIQADSGSVELDSDELG